MTMLPDDPVEVDGPLAPRRPWLAALMSLVLPGFGQLYNGQLNPAIWFFLAFALLGVPGLALIALHLPDRATVPALAVGLLAALGLWIGSTLHAWRVARGLTRYRRQAWQVSGVYALLLLLCDLVVLPMLITEVRTHQVESFHIPSASMAPSVLPGDVIFADKRYNCPGCKRSVSRGDIAIFVYPDDPTLKYIKRIVGLPGDRVQLQGHELRINGERLQQGHATALPGGGQRVTEATSGRTWVAEWGAAPLEPLDLVVPSGQVFVLGDQRAQSRDSRQFGPVPLVDVVGRARQVWMSLDHGRIRWERLGRVLE